MYKTFHSIMVIFFLALSIFAQDLDVVQIKTPQCILKIDANLKWHTLSVRGPTLISGKNYTITEADLLKLIEKLVAENDSLLMEQTFFSLFLGRLVEYPWLQAFLMRRAAESPEWQAKRGKLTRNTVNINAWVASILFLHPIWEKINQRFDKSGYQLSGISVEKVLVNEVSKINLDSVKDLKGKLPFDAQVWLVLVKDK